MAVFTVHPIVVPGDTWTASNQVTYIKNNLDAIFVGQARGDLDFYSGPNSKSRLALVVGGLLHGGALDPEWLAPPAVLSILQHNGSAASYLAKGAARSILRVNANGDGFEFSNSQMTIVGGSGNQAVTAGNPVLWSTEVVDDGNWHSTVSNTSRITVTESGRYRPGCVLGLWTPTGGATVPYNASLRVNGSVKYFNRKAIYQDGQMYTMEFPAIPLELTAGQYVEIIYDSGGNINMDYSYFSLERVP